MLRLCGLGHDVGVALGSSDRSTCAAICGGVSVVAMVGPLTWNRPEVTGVSDAETPARGSVAAGKQRAERLRPGFHARPEPGRERSSYGTNSNAPTSHAASRATPRWSVAGHTAVSAASMAGLPASNAWVSVGPPLSASGPSRAPVTTTCRPVRFARTIVDHVDPPRRDGRRTATFDAGNCPAVTFQHVVGQRRISRRTERCDQDAGGSANRSDVVTIVLFSIVTVPSVWKMPPPCQAVEMLPLIV